MKTLATGVILDRDGNIATNYHLALLKIDAEGRQPIALADTTTSR